MRAVGICRTLEMTGRWNVAAYRFVRSTAPTNVCHQRAGGREEFPIMKNGRRRSLWHRMLVANCAEVDAGHSEAAGGCLEAHATRNTRLTSSVNHRTPAGGECVDLVDRVRSRQRSNSCSV